MNKEYDAIIIGGGPAGLSAGIYTSRARLKSLLLEKAAVGGQIVNAELVENYPGFPQGISGLELAGLMQQQAAKYGLETLLAEARQIEAKEGKTTIKTTEGDMTASAIIVASGSERDKLGVPGEKEFTGKGVSYCAICDGVFFRDMPVAVIGGGDAAMGEALNLTQFASQITVIHRRNQLRASRIVQERAFAEPKIKFLWDTVVDEIRGEKVVRQLSLRNVKTGANSALEVAGVFVSVGFTPNTAFLEGAIPLDEAGHVITDERMETRVPGIFAAGDVRHNSPRQASTAAGDGVTAAIYAEKSIRRF